MPNYDVDAKHHFFMPNNFKKGQISGIWPKKCQPGNPGPILPHQEQIHADKLGVPN